MSSNKDNGFQQLVVRWWSIRITMGPWYRGGGTPVCKSCNDFREAAEQWCLVRPLLSVDCPSGHTDEEEGLKCLTWCVVCVSEHLTLLCGSGGRSGIGNCRTNGVFLQLISSDKYFKYGQREWRGSTYFAPSTRWTLKQNISKLERQLKRENRISTPLDCLVLNYSADLL
jgi:hypothetical protein